MDYQVSHVVFKRLVRKRGFPRDSFRRKDDISKKPTSRLRERQHVGWRCPFRAMCCLVSAWRHRR